MDLGHLENLLQNIELSVDYTHKLAEYCVTNSKGIEAQISKMLQKSFQSHFLNGKLSIFMVVSEIYMITGAAEQKDTRFFKHLSQKTKGFIQQLSRRCNQIKPQHIHIVPQYLVKWMAPGHELFASTFMDKLLKIAEPIIIASKKVEQDKKNGIFQNYTKTFLMEYEDMKSYEPTNRIYQDYRMFCQIAKEIGQINQQTTRLSLEQPTQEVKERANILKQKFQNFAYKLQDIICGYHVDYKILRQACKQQFDKLPQDARKLLGQESEQ